MLGGGLEPPCLSAYAPQTYVSAISPPERVRRVNGKSEKVPRKCCLRMRRLQCAGRGMPRRGGLKPLTKTTGGFKPPLDHCGTLRAMSFSYRTYWFGLSRALCGLRRI